MALILANGTESTTGAPIKTLRPDVASFKRIREDIEREGDELVYQQKASSQQILLSDEDETLFDGWDSSPEPPAKQQSASNGVCSFVTLLFLYANNSTDNVHFRVLERV